MTEIQRAVASGSMQIQVHDSMMLLIKCADALQLNRIDTAVRSCKAIEEKASGWTAKRISDDSYPYLVVFKPGVQSGQHKVMIMEVIEQTVPGIVIHSN